MNSIIIIITGILGTILTFYVSNQLKQGVVRASALLSLIIALFFYCFPQLLNTYLTENIPIVFIGASFVGMVSSKSFSHYGLLTIAGTLFGIIYTNQSHFFIGYGGTLGTIALITLLATKGILIFRKWLLNKKTK